MSRITFRIDAFVAKVLSPIIFVADGAETYFEAGKELALRDFSKRYSIKALYAKENKIVIEAEEVKVNEPFNYSGEAALSNI